MFFFLLTLSTIFESRQMTRKDKYTDKTQQNAKRANILFDISMWKEKESPFRPLNKILKKRESRSHCLSKVGENWHLQNCLMNEWIWLKKNLQHLQKLAKLKKNASSAYSKGYLKKWNEFVMKQIFNYNNTLLIWCISSM